MQPTHNGRAMNNWDGDRMYVAGLVFLPLIGWQRQSNRDKDTLR